MNFIAGYLLLITKSEEESFWLLDALVGRILPGTLTQRAAFHPIHGDKVTSGPGGWSGNSSLVGS